MLASHSLVSFVQSHVVPQFAKPKQKCQSQEATAELFPFSHQSPSSPRVDLMEDSSQDNTISSSTGNPNNMVTEVTKIFLPYFDKKFVSLQKSI